MSNPESVSPFPPEIQPGTLIEFNDITQLAAFEDTIAPFVTSRYKPEYWESRRPLKDVLRVPEFNGRMSDIAMQVMEAPYERLLDARERGWKITGGSLARPQAPEDVIRHYMGFAYTANARSSGRGVVGQVQAEIWYAPNADPHGYGRAVKRTVTKPKFEEAAFRELDEHSRRIGFTALRYALIHAYRG